MTGILYRYIVRPILFLFPADTIHKWALSGGRFLGGSSLIRTIFNGYFSYKSDLLHQNIAGISFDNPIGLAAGFDYDADLIQIIPPVGFGFHTVGTVTYGVYAGNPAPMLKRLPKSRSLLVNKGFKNSGIKNVLEKISRAKGSIPLGMSIGSTNRRYESFLELVGEIIKAFEVVLQTNYFQYYELNISCPNLINIGYLGESVDNPAGLNILLNQLSRLNVKNPVFIKMPIEKSVEESAALCDVAVRFPFVRGIILGNLVKNRDNRAFDSDEIANIGKGNFSGKPTEILSNILIGEMYVRYKDRLIIIGCGGVFDGKDAYEKIRRGASLVQIITGMVYMGPQQIGVINREIVELLRRDRYSSLQEAIGSFQEKQPV